MMHDELRKAFYIFQTMEWKALQVYLYKFFDNLLEYVSGCGREGVGLYEPTYQLHVHVYGLLYENI